MLKTENLNKREYGKILLKDFNIDLKKGELLVFLGDERSGRKDILDIISGFKKPNNGRVLIEGIPVQGNVLKTRAYLGYSGVLDIYKNFTVKNFIKLMTKVRKIKNDEIDKETEKILKLVDFKEDPDTKISDLDEVEERKLSIASAFIGSPEIVLLDDPFFNIKKDESIENIANILISLKKDFIIILSTNAEISIKLADRLFVLTHEGQVEINLKDLEKEGISLKEKQEEILKEKNIKGKNYDE